ncbi:MAG: CopL family metal-binding regulatory protein [Luteimonas sp.]
MRPLLFRLLLCVTLLLNGIGSGMASVHVAMMDMSAGPAHTTPVTAADGGCPHAAGARTDGAHDDRDAPAPAADDGDCLKLCAGICLQHCHVLPMAHAPATTAAVQLAPVPPLSAGPPSVRANPLLRPPIAA